MSATADVRLIAFYLPQFHPIPENDAWWGTGFTEWTNVTRAVPLYRGHDQPRRPGELGYYDLRTRDIRHRQATLAREHGIHGFCYYYYWFSGRRLLERPLDQMLADRDLDFPFCVCWANENWSRRWDGSEQDVLMAQDYRPEDPERFIRDLAPTLKDPRYITVDGAPLLLVYRAGIIPDIRGTIAQWRATAAALGIPQLHLCAMQTALYTSGLDDGFDAMVEFPPHSIVVGEITSTVADLAPDFEGKIFSYSDVVSYSTALTTGVRLPIYRGLMTGWDNTARRRLRSHVFDGATPEHYEVWLRRLIAYTRRHHQGDARLIFVNAWNEWAEGAYLEPDETFRHGYLEATRRALRATTDHGDVFDALRRATQGNDEAQALLAELEQIVRVKEETVALVEAREAAAQRPTRAEISATFHPIASSGFEMPATFVADGATGFLDALNTPNYQRGVTLNRAYDVLIQGWVASRDVAAGENSPVILQLTRIDSGDRYVARILSRTRRDDVVAHLQSQRAYRTISADQSLYSGYRAYMNIAALEPGSYTLDAILPLPDGRRGVTLRLHSAIVVV
jgi:lipopolysaccharide biosynthesis protein